MEDNQLCRQCQTAEAEEFCQCTAPETFLCIGCIRKHRSAKPGLDHTTRPLNMLPLYKIPGAIERFHARCSAFHVVRQAAFDSVEQVDRAIHAYATEVEQLIWTITVRAEAVKKELETLQTQYRRDVEATVEEVERTMNEDRPTLKSAYGALLRGMAEQTCTGQLFSYTLKRCTTPPETLVAFRYQLPGLVTRLAAIYESTAILYEVSTERLTKHSLSVNFGAGGSYVELDSDRLLCVGAQPARAAVYECDLSSFQLTPWPALSTARCAAGTAKVGARVYVFGGGNGKTVLRSCEKVEVTEKQWRALGDMNFARGAFTPCCFNGLLYLVSCNKCAERKVETFDPNTEAFTVLQVFLPPQLALDCASVAFVLQGELCLLTYEKQMCRWKVDRESEFRLSNTGAILWSNQQPFIAGSVLLIACPGVAEVFQFSLETYSFIKRVG